MSKRLLRFVEFLDCFSLFSTSKFAGHIREDITPQSFEWTARPEPGSSGRGQANDLFICCKGLSHPSYQIGLKESKNRQRKNLLTVFKAFENWDIENR